MSTLAIRFSIVITLLFVMCLLFSSCTASRTDRGHTLAEQVAGAYGIARWDEVNELNFTFNMQSGGRRVVRTWKWEPKTKRVTYHGLGPDREQTTITYRPFEITDDSRKSLKWIDHWFVHDQYLLLFPIHLAWDNTISLAEKGEHPLPVGDGTALQLVVTCGESNPYTPGDTYELYIGDDYRIMQWVHRNGEVEHSFNPIIFQNHINVGPIMVCTEYSRPGSDFRMWFSDVSVK